MTNATIALIDELSQIVDQNKYMILSGGSGVGKTFLASAIAHNCEKLEYNSQGDVSTDAGRYEIVTEFVPIHSSFSYEDFVSGISIKTEDGEVFFEYEDKMLLSLLKEANESWKIKDRKKYFLILDDIGRGAISGILGDVLPLIETHGNSSLKIKTNGYPSSVWLSPNVYIIATLSTTTDSVEQFNYGFFRHFYIKDIENDFRYMDNDASPSYSDYDITANAMYYRSKRIVKDNLRHRYQLAAIERERYVIGHGVFKENGTTMIVRYQVVPTLKQYVKDGILDKTARTSIDALEKLVAGKYSKDFSLADVNRIHIKKSGVTSESFKQEGLTHQPMVNLVSRIKEQGLLDDVDISEGIMFNPQVLVRKKAKLDKVERVFPSPGYLYVERKNRDIYTYGTTISKGKPKSPRFFYSGSKNDMAIVDGIEYSIASEMQPKEYTRWYEDLDSGTEENERYSSSPNSIMFRILRSYYRALNQHYSAYLDEYPGDDNISRLKAYAAQEYNSLVSKTRKLHPEISDEADVNAKANVEFRNVISELVLLWKNRGETINIGGQIITVEGVYKVDNKKKYEEYSHAMDTLDIHQMIMQGPPGTSKTYSAREYLKFIGRADDKSEFLSDEELDSLQIKNYSKNGYLSEWAEKHSGTVPKIAWDIVQFHPSYGYEDFVRGIEVSTIKSKDGDKSVVSYDTVNKILGEMAEVASRPEYMQTKFILVIDEINRANLATVFGELIYGLEYRGKSVSTPYTVDDSNKVALPDNLYILGTMNTADKSIGGIDYAIRRRFLFFSLLPDRNTILEYKTGIPGSSDSTKQQIEINEKAVLLFDRVAELFSADNLNNEYYKDDVQIGHTYFLVSSEEQLYLRFRYQILPILREYYKDGMFQFDNPTNDSDGWSGLLECITGDIDINKEEDKVRDIFEKLIRPE